MDNALELVADRQHQQIGERDAVDGGDERDCNTAAQLARVSQVAHHMDQPHYCTDDADGGRVPAHAFEHLGCADITAFLGIEIDLKDAADHFRLGTIHQQLQPFARVGVGFGFSDRLESQQALLARGIAPVGDAADAACQIDARRHDDPTENCHGAHEHRHRRLQQNSAQGTAQHDQSSGAVE